MSEESAASTSRIFSVSTSVFTVDRSYFYKPYPITNIDYLRILLDTREEKRVFLGKLVVAIEERQK
ncbi:MAG: hypothetical protein CSA34_06270 [Desulfobulbus propionicus]|nr:MAG: hypothetical protein CSA34_06270 [Desulfobulbus propionicus]